MIRVLIADDQHLVRAGLTALLNGEDDIDVVAAAADGNEAIRLARELRPDVACLDIRMPGRDGIEVADVLCGPDSELGIPVLILTTFDLDDYVFRALEVGVSGFLLKDSEPDDIIRAITRISDGHGMLDHTLTRRIVTEYVQRRALRPVTATRAIEALTARERDILLLLAQGMSNEQIAAQLFVEVATVKSHLARLLPKLGVQSRLQAAVWAYQNRVVTVGDAPR
ncbi:DNA-binding response regulator [Pseudoclavibacter endophyticus]|uniref:Response regulator transcription factor n=1 Tax=Pseudoclavibacter endophyticus TaxID=1778590 RepID=A0A6H9WNG0_9MICO|nr:response regulator transcription factor [Pseudoclavibacter endophyticus]KAB1649241.1 response regulator transcription factor [Pseudoclavibacter endophyticus]GGA64206.1 DNA-binding response regulator [Pseudoclavibacter endophyticus]